MGRGGHINVPTIGVSWVVPLKVGTPSPLTSEGAGTEEVSVSTISAGGMGYSKELPKTPFRGALPRVGSLPPTAVKGGSTRKG